jgi:hypothetical protein
MEKSFKITLSDGTKFENLKLSGNYYITQKEITEKDFKGKLSKVIIEETEDKKTTKNEYTHMELIQILHYEDGYYFALRELSQDEIDKITIQSNIEYLAMMTGVDLEEV